MSKLSDATKQVELATRDLQREQDDWRTKLADYHREELQLKESIRVLRQKRTKLETKTADLREQVDTLTVEHAALEVSITENQHKLDITEDKRASKATELADLHAEVEKRKRTIDSELEAYSIERKQAIKDNILTVNAELLAARRELDRVRVNRDAAADQLRDINTAIIDEQTDNKLLKSALDTELTEKREELSKVEEDVTFQTQKLQSLVYERDQALMSIQKAEEQHQKFVNYERKARKVLDAKDRALQEKDAEISQQSQYLSNQRSFLPPL